MKNAEQKDYTAEDIRAIAQLVKFPDMKIIQGWRETESQANPEMESKVAKA